MGTKRTRVTRNNTVRVTDAAVEAFRCALDAGSDRSRFLEFARTLHRELRLKPWELGPLDVETDSEPCGDGTAGDMSIPQAVALRAELLRRVGNA